MDYYDPCFCGTEVYYKCPIGNMCYTESVQYFCHSKEAYWILDLIGSYLFKQPFLVLTINVKPENKIATFTAKEDSDLPNVVTQNIAYTDLDVSVKLYLINNVLLFPSDY